MLPSPVEKSGDAVPPRPRPNTPLGLETSIDSSDRRALSSTAPQQHGAQQQDGRSAANASSVTFTAAVALFYQACTTTDGFVWRGGVVIRHGTGSLGHRVNGSFRSSFTSGSPGHRVILTRCEFFRFSKKMSKMQNVHLKCGYRYSYLLT